MKAMVLKEPDTPFELTQVPDPVAGAGEAVARVIACGSGLTIQPHQDRENIRRVSTDHRATRLPAWERQLAVAPPRHFDLGAALLK